MRSIGKSCDALFILRVPVAGILSHYYMQPISFDLSHGQYGLVIKGNALHSESKEQKSAPLNCLY